MEALLTEAERCWETGNREACLRLYGEALQLATDATRSQVLIGRAFALTQMGRGSEAVPDLLDARADAAGNVQLVAFVDDLLRQAQAGEQREVGVEEAFTTIAARFSGTLVFGVEDREFGLDAGREALMHSVALATLALGARLGCRVIDVSAYFDADQIQQLRLPRAFANGEPVMETCHANLDLDVDAWTSEERAVVHFVRDFGARNWSLWNKAEGSGTLTAEAAKQLWLGGLRTKVLEALENGTVPMPCGHSCNTCPSKTTCGVHADIEDM